MTELRGVWIHDSTCRGLGGARVASECHEHGFNVLLPKVPWFSGAQADPQYWRQVMGPMIQEAHRLGMEVHAWIFFLNDASVDGEPDLMQVMETGERKDLACAANPESVRKNLGKIEPILGSFELDGLNLEDCFVYHRWPDDPPTCFCSHCREHAPEEPEARKKYNRDALTRLLREVVEESKRHRPEIKISAAARVPYQSHGLAMSTDWKAWCELGLLDYLAPMIYQQDDERLREVTEETMELVQSAAAPVCVGLGAYKIDRDLTGHDLPPQLANQIAITRELGADGQILYHMGGITADQYIRVEQAYSDRAALIW